MSGRYKLNPGYITQKIGTKTTVFFGEKSILLTFNDTAALIFQGLKLGWDEKKIIEKLVDAFDIDPKTAEKDIKDFTKELLKKKILLDKKH